MSANRNSQNENPSVSKGPQNSSARSRWSGGVAEDERTTQKVDSSQGVFYQWAHSPWVRSHPDTVKLLLAGVLSLAAIMVVILWRVGWGRHTAPASAPPVAQSPTPPVHATQASPPSKPSVASTNPSPRSDEVSRPTSPIQNQPPAALPDDLSKWTPDDFARAHRENNPKLLQAIALLGPRSRGDPSAVVPLVALLKPPPVEPSVAHPSRELSSPIDPLRLSEAVLKALGENGTKPACTLLRQFLSSENDAVVETALKALTDQPNENTEAVLLEAVLSPETFRSADSSGKWPAKQLRIKAFELLKPTASHAARRRLAESLAERLIWIPPDDPIRQFLLAPDPLNCDAQIVIYEKAEMIRDIKTKLEQQLTELSAAALADRLGIAETSRGRLGDRNNVDSAALAELLWSGPLLARIESQLSELRSFEKQPNLAVLAATVPRDSTRALLARLLRKNWNDGPKTLESLGLFDRIVTDPGLLVLLKIGPRKDHRSSNGNPRGRSAALSVRSARLAQVEQDWWDASAKLASTWRKRLSDVATARVKAAIETGRMPKAANPNLPPDFVLGDNTRVKATYDFHWPPSDSETSENAEDDLLEIHYLRLKEWNRPKKAISFYGRQAQVRVNDVRTTDRTIWLDGQRTDAKLGQRRSIDIFVTKSDQHDEASKDDKEKEPEQDLLIEVLTIEIKDPTVRD